MLLMPPPNGTCPICAVKHSDDMPHNQQSLYYQYRFYGTHGRWPTWADAIAHCDFKMREFWEIALKDKGHWSEPESGEPIADPMHDAIRQPIGDPNSTTFGPDNDT